MLSVKCSVKGKEDPRLDPDAGILNRCLILRRLMLTDPPIMNSPRSLPVFRALAAAWLLLASSTIQAVDVERTGGPYVPTPQAVVDAMLELANVGPTDFVI